MVRISFSGPLWDGDSCAGKTKRNASSMPKQKASIAEYITIWINIPRRTLGNALGTRFTQLELKKIGLKNASFA